jgi:hypothetical protein
MPGRLVNPGRTLHGRYLALPDFQQGKFHFPISSPHLNADHGFRSPAFEGNEGLW